MRYNKNTSRRRQAFCKLYGERAPEYERMFYRNRKRIVVAVLLLTGFMAVLAALTGTNHSEILNGKYIKRNGKEESDKTLRVNASSSEGYSDELTLLIENRHYTEEELEAMYIPFKEELMQEIVPTGQSLNRISSDMNLVKNIKNYPFSVEWHSDNPVILSSAGIVNEDKLFAMNKEITVILTAIVSYAEEERELMIPVILASGTRSDEELFWETVNSEIERMSKASLTEEYQILPTAIDGQTLRYSDKKTPVCAVIIVCGILTAILLVSGKDEDLYKKANERDEQLRQDYPQFINRIALYYGAGLSIKNIWQRMCADYEQKKHRKHYMKHAVYEEMLRCEKRMRDGVGEEDAYDQFAANIGLSEYKTVISILQQAIRTGGSNIGYMLRERRMEAYEEQKKRARVLGEKAGTKLLFPMFMMLIVVLIVILVPAFLSF